MIQRSKIGLKIFSPAFSTPCLSSGPVNRNQTVKWCVTLQSRYLRSSVARKQLARTSLKSYLDRKVESLASGLVFQTTSGTQKLERTAEAGKLKFQGNKDQSFLILNYKGLWTIQSISWLRGTLTKAPSTRIWIFLNPQLFLSGYGYRPRAYGEIASKSGNFSCGTRTANSWFFSSLRKNKAYFEKLRWLSEVERLLVGVIGSFEKSRLEQ